MLGNAVLEKMIVHTKAVDGNNMGFDQLERGSMRTRGVTRVQQHVANSRVIHRRRRRVWSRSLGLFGVPTMGLLRIPILIVYASE